VAGPRTDIAALAAAAIAVPVTLFLTSGPYDATDFIVGLTLLLLIIGFGYTESERSKWQRAAIAGVFALASLPVVGFTVDSLAVLRGLGCGPASCLNSWWHLGVWVIVSVAAYSIDYFQNR